MKAVRRLFKILNKACVIRRSEPLAFRQWLITNNTKTKKYAKSKRLSNWKPYIGVWLVRN